MVWGREMRWALTLQVDKELEAAGVSRDQAEAQVRALAQHALPDLATKDELRSAIAELKHDLTMLFALLRWGH
jgi:hypothetical protein